MTSFLTVGIKTRIICEGDTLAEALVEGITQSEAGYLAEGDIIVVAESAVATSEGRIVRLDTVIPRPDSLILGAKYGIDPRLAEVVRTESDEIIGGIPGHLLCMKGGTLLPNAGVDASNAPPGCVVLLPRDPDRSARDIRQELERRTGVRTGVIIADSRTHAMRSGCSGVAIGCSGIPSVIDARGQPDLFGRPLEVTRKALADNIASAAEIVMGEAAESTPAALIRGLGIPIGDYEGIESIAAEDCLFMGLLAGLKGK